MKWYIKDTNDSLNKLRFLPKLPNDIILCTIELLDFSLIFHRLFIDVYEKVPDDPEPLINTIHATLEKIRKKGDLKKENI